MTAQASTTDLRARLDKGLALLRQMEDAGQIGTEEEDQWNYWKYLRHFEVLLTEYEEAERQTLTEGVSA